MLSPLQRPNLFHRKKTEVPKPLSEAKEPSVADLSAAPSEKTKLSKLETEQQKPESKLEKQELSTKQTFPSLQSPAEMAMADAKKELSKTPDVFLPSASPQGQYSIHVGSFRNKDNASDLSDRLKNKGYPVSFKFVEVLGKGGWYRVKVGNYSNLEDTHQVALKLKTEEKTPAIILKRK